MRSRSISFLLVLILISLNVFAGTTGKISGLVTDKSTGEPLIGVNIFLEGTVFGSTTDLDGTFIILNIPPGTYTLISQYLGYAEVKMSEVKISVDFTTNINIEMQSTAIEASEAVEVVAEREVIRKDLTSSQAEVTSGDIENLPSEEFEDVLQLQAGITRDESGGFHIRGGRSSEVAFWVDGVSVTDGYDGSVAVEIENSAIQSLQVISGTFNAEYGQAMSGIINIVTKEGGDKLSGQISAYTGDYISNAKEIFVNIDDVSPSQLYDFKASLDGPVPLTRNKVRFFVNFRHNYDDGWLYGQRKYQDTGQLVQDSVLGTIRVPLAGDGKYVAMNPNKWYNGQANLTFQLTSLIKVRLKFDYENREFREFDHGYKWNPDGDLNKFQRGYNASFTYDHTLNATTFYTVKFSRYEKDFKQYVYEDPTNPRYVGVEGGDQNLFEASEFFFSKGGQKKQHFNRTTTTNIAKADLTSQITKKHLLKFGVEGRLHKIDFLDYEVIDGNEGDGQVLFTPVEPTQGNPNFTQYSFEPIEFSVYFQDKMEYEDFIVNIGLRFDYFDSRGRVLADPKDPYIYAPILTENQNLTFEQRLAKWYKDPKAKLQFSPRVGVAYPISAKGVVHFSYGHFLQIPEFQRLYQNPDFKVTRASGIDNLIGNADLDAQRTIMYEIGLQQELTQDIGIDVTGFYRDIRNWVDTSPIQQTYAVDIGYSQFINRAYANVRGITFALKKRFSHNFSANVDYTYQVAEGSASDPEDAFNAAKDNEEPVRSIVPLDWDRTNILNGNVYFGLGGFGISLLGRYESGLPYTLNPVQGSRIGANVETGLPRNGERRPTLITFDLQVYKDIFINMGGRSLKWSLFAKVFNLFDRRNEQQVFDDTGRATYTQKGDISGENVDPEAFIYPQYYTEPRRVQVGFSFGF